MLPSYLARVGLTLAGGTRRPKAGVLDDVRLPLRVWPSDLDAYGHVNNGRYLTLMDLGRLEFGMRTGLARELVRRRWLPTVGAATVRFRRELKAFTPFELSTRLAYWDEKWLYIEHRLLRGDVLHARAFVMVVVQQARRTVPPADVLAALGHHAPPAEPPEELSLWIRAQALMGRGEGRPK